MVCYAENLDVSGEGGLDVSAWIWVRTHFVVWERVHVQISSNEICAGHVNRVSEPPDGAGDSGISCGGPATYTARGSECALRGKSR